MNLLKLLLVALICASVVSPAFAKSYRDPQQRTAFKKDHPCPSTGKTKGACPGYVIDHITPLCAGGADTPANMQWQSKEAAKLKDREERQECRR